MLLDSPHWVVGDHRYTNQFQTWLAIQNTDQPARFNLYENEFDHCDWSKEPAETWDQLLHARCLQLRQKYRNLKLLYSGGRDSHCILRAFVKHNIPIDELLIVDYSLNPVRSNEYKIWIEPMAKKYLQHNPQAKLTTITVGLNEYQQWYAEDWSEQSNMNMVRGFFQPSDYSWMIQQQCKIADSNTGIICGLEKPYLKLKENKLYSTVEDAPFLHYFNNLNIIEFFYITPDLPELHIKQCHMLINYLEQHYPGADYDFLKEFHWNVRSKYYDEFCISVGRGPAVDVTSPSQNGRGKYLGDHPAFQVLGKIIRKEIPKVWNQYQENINWFADRNPTAFYQGGGQTGTKINHGIIPIEGKHYFVRDWSVAKN